MDFDFSPETLMAVASAATPPKHTGTQEDPYNLATPAKVIVPSGATLRNRISVQPAEAAVTQSLAIRNTVTIQGGLSLEGDITARRLAELISALKNSEDAWIRQTLERLGVTDLDPTSVATHFALGESRDYYGTVEHQDDGTIVYTVLHDVCLLTPEPVLLCPLS